MQVTRGGADNQQQVQTLKQSITQEGNDIKRKDTRRIQNSKLLKDKVQGHREETDKTNTETGDKR